MSSATRPHVRLPLVLALMGVLAAVLASPTAHAADEGQTQIRFSYDWQTARPSVAALTVSGRYASDGGFVSRGGVTNTWSCDAPTDRGDTQTVTSCLATVFNPSGYHNILSLVSGDRSRNGSMEIVGQGTRLGWDKLPPGGIVTVTGDWKVASATGDLAGMEGAGTFSVTLWSDESGQIVRADQVLTGRFICRLVRC